LGGRELADAANAFISSAESYWDKDWLASFGGVDDPFERTHHHPVGFTPKENSFYVALPFGDFACDGSLKPKARDVPWYQPGLTPLLKNRWVEIRHNLLVCFAQWRTSGPAARTISLSSSARLSVPLNTFDVNAVWNALGMKENAVTAWRSSTSPKCPMAHGPTSSPSPATIAETGQLESISSILAAAAKSRKRFSRRVLASASSPHWLIWKSSST
jgi:hypothetical protein